MNIVLIGAGNVATHLGKAFQKSGHKVIQVYSRTSFSAKELAKKLRCNYSDNIENISKDGDFYIIAKKDAAIENFCTQFKIKRGIIIHTSGSMPLETLRSCSENYGVFYPLQTFSKRKQVTFRNIPICIEAINKRTERKLIKLATSISDNVFKITSNQRKVLHIAAVFINNFSNHLFTIAEKILKQENLSFDLLKPLMKETMNKAIRYDPANMQTGPAIRGDKNIIERHLKYLASTPNYRKIYEIITKSIEKTKD